MLNFQSKKIVIVLVGILFICIAGGVYFLAQTLTQKEIKNEIIVTDFDSCVKGGYPVMESYPRQCRDDLGNLYVEEIEDGEPVNPPEKKCVRGGCSGQLCVEAKEGESPVMTTCEDLPEYACYRGSTCELQSNGECGWTMTDDLKQCLKKAREDTFSADLNPVTTVDPKPIQNEKPQSTPSIKDKKISWGYESASDRVVSAIILHSSYNPLGGEKYDVNAIVDIYKDYGVSAHYIIGRDGTIYRLVSEKNIAYHAGVSKLPNGETNVNAVSIGIEIVVDDKGDTITGKQYSAINVLIADIKSRYKIKHILGHSDIAPERKTDPWGIDWKKINK